MNGQANGYEGESEGEEDKRIGAAQGIIRQITTGLDDEQGNHVSNFWFFSENYSFLYFRRVLLVRSAEQTWECPTMKADC